MEGNGETKVEVYQCIGKQKKHFRGKSETDLAHAYFNPKKKKKKASQKYICALENKKKIKKPFRGKNETGVSHVQNFTDFNKKKKKSFTEGSEKTSLFLSCQTEVYP